MIDCLQLDDAELQRMGEAARERVLARHDVDDAATKLAKLFREHAGEAVRSQPRLVTSTTAG